MKLKLVIDKLEDVDEPLRGLYVEKDGKFHLDVDGLEDTAPLKRAITAERQARAKLEEQKKAWEKLGKSPEEIEELIAASAQAEQDKLAKAGEWDKLRQQMNDKHSADIKALQAKLDAKDNELNQLRTSYHSSMIKTEATAAIAAAKGIPRLLLSQIQPFVKVIDNNGALALQVVDENGGQRVNGKGDPLTVSDLVTEMKGDPIFARCFEGSGASGSGAPPNGGNPPPPADSKYKRRSDFKTEKERSTFIEAHGFESFAKLPL